MAYYVNGTLISGANTLPKMTMAEYLALPADQRPTYWECTDKDYDEISAENVSYKYLDTPSKYDGTVDSALDKVIAQIIEKLGISVTGANVTGVRFYYNNDNNWKIDINAKNGKVLHIFIANPTIMQYKIMVLLDNTELFRIT